MGRLDGKVAIVTGAARGIGLEYAFRLGQLGAKVAVCDRDLESAQEFESERARLTHGNLLDTLAAVSDEAMAEQVDMTVADDVTEFVDAVADRWGQVDVLVNNAGGGGNFGGAIASELDPTAFGEIFARNTQSTVFAVGAATPHMKKQMSGKIVNVSSVAGVMAYSNGQLADYAMAKAAVLHYTRYLAVELGPYGITANAIAPGLIGTGQLKAKTIREVGDDADDMAADIPLRRIGTPEDCANVLEFLATDLADYITGQVITVDGGYVRGPR